VKLWKKILIGIAAVIALAVVALVTKFYLLSPEVRPAAAMTAPSTPEAIARGKYLFEDVMVCIVCHSSADETQPGSPVDMKTIGQGRTFGPENELPGKLSGKNLTPDKTVGLGAWSDGEIVRAIREGVSRDGRPLFPQMPYRAYRTSLSDEDALAIVAYLRTLPPSSHDPGPTNIIFPVSMFIRAVPQPVTAPIPPPPADPQGRGRWLLRAAGCNQCHDSADAQHRPIEGKELGGGMALPFAKGVVYAANISSDPATGIGSYSDEDLMRVLDEGKSKAGRPLYVMPWAQYKNMTVEDKRAIIAALRASKPVVNTVPPAKL